MCTVADTERSIDRCVTSASTLTQSRVYRQYAKERSQGTARCGGPIGVPAPLQCSQCVACSHSHSPSRQIRAAARMTRAVCGSAHSSVGSVLFASERVTQRPASAYRPTPKSAESATAASAAQLWRELRAREACSPSRASWLAVSKRL